MTQRLIPPSNGFYNPITVLGTVYTCAANSTIDVPNHVATVMQANGWLPASANGADTTANRPSTAGLKIGTQFHDTTLGYNITWDGKVWRNPTNGAQV